MSLFFFTLDSSEKKMNNVVVRSTKYELIVICARRKKHVTKHSEQREPKNIKIY